jgi:hypothetical protein
MPRGNRFVTPGRRTFLSLLATSAAGMAAMGPLALAQARRKQAVVGGRRVKTVDVHAHAAIKEVERVIRGTTLERTIPSRRGSIRSGPRPSSSVYRCSCIRRARAPSSAKTA